MFVLISKTVRLYIPIASIQPSHFCGLTPYLTLKTIDYTNLKLLVACWCASILTWNICNPTLLYKVCLEYWFLAIAALAVCLQCEWRSVIYKCQNWSNVFWWQNNLLFFFPPKHLKNMSYQQILDKNSEIITMGKVMVFDVQFVK